jgi:NodT family efflux transporter outer membrane factor (OMF) lipoprotein
MGKTRKNRGLVLAYSLVALLVSGCAVKEAPTADAVVEKALPDTTEVPGQWSAEALDTGKVDDGWIKSFNDSRLDALVAEAMENNPNLTISAAQVERAAALARVAGAALKPTVALAGDIAETGSTTDRVEGTTYGVGLTVSWEADVWGRVRAGTAAAKESLKATEADYEYARQSLAAATAKSWFLATESMLQVELAQEIVRVYNESVDIAEARHEVGRVSMKDVHLARADLASAEEALRQARTAHEQALRSLEVLLGRYPSADLETGEQLVAVPPPIPVGLPSDIIARRPDLIAAERRVASAFYLAEEARLARLPRFSLTGTAGSSDLASAIASLGAGMVAPLYAGGALEAQLEAATADQKAVVAAYAQILLRAFQEVETSLANEKLLKEREGFPRAVVEENAQALRLSKAEYEVGKTDMLSVLLTQARWVAARVSLLRIQDERLLERVNLHLALGGSFEQGQGEGADPDAGASTGSRNP